MAEDLLGEDLHVAHIERTAEAGSARMERDSDGIRTYNSSDVLQVEIPSDGTSPLAPTPAAADSSTKVATTAFVAGASPLVTAASSLPASPPNGTNALLRAGSSPYEFVKLAWDGTYAKWVSSVFGQMEQIVASHTSTAGAFELTTTAQCTRLLIPGGKVLYDAGLRLQVFPAVQMNGSAGGINAFADVAIYEVSNSDTALTLLLNSSDLQVTGTTSTYRIPGWIGFDTATTTDDHWVAIFRKAQGGGGTATFSNMNARFRWVYTP